MACSPQPAGEPGQEETEAVELGIEVKDANPSRSQGSPEAPAPPAEPVEEPRSEPADGRPAAPDVEFTLGPAIAAASTPARIAHPVPVAEPDPLDEQLLRRWSEAGLDFLPSGAPRLGAEVSRPLLARTEPPQASPPPPLPAPPLGQLGSGADASRNGAGLRNISAWASGGLRTLGSFELTAGARRTQLVQTPLTRQMSDAWVGAERAMFDGRLGLRLTGGASFEDLGPTLPTGLAELEVRAGDGARWSVQAGHRPIWSSAVRFDPLGLMRIRSLPDLDAKLTASEVRLEADMFDGRSRAVRLRGGFERLSDGNRRLYGYLEWEIPVTRNGPTLSVVPNTWGERNATRTQGLVSPIGYGEVGIGARFEAGRGRFAIEGMVNPHLFVYPTVIGIGLASRGTLNIDTGGPLLQIHWAGVDQAIDSFGQLGLGLALPTR